MITKEASEVKAKIGQANDALRRATNPFVCGLSEWIEWRAQKLQGLRQEVIGKTRKPRMTGKPGLAHPARVA